MSTLRERDLQKENSLIKIWRNIKTISILLILAPFIVLAGFIYGEEFDNIYNKH